MDSSRHLPIIVQERKAATKKAKAKKKPMKVVYISNPMKFNTSASQFRALVQELTGQDAEFPDPTKFNPDGYDHVAGNQTVPDAQPKGVDHDIDHGSRSPDHSPEQPERPDAPPSSTDQSFEDDHFVLQMMMVDSFSSFWPHESSGHSNLDVLRSPYNYAL